MDIVSPLDTICGEQHQYMNSVQVLLISIVEFHPMLPNTSEDLVLCSEVSITMHLFLLHLKNRNQGICFFIFRHWCLQWLDLAMPLFPYTGDFAKLQGMGVLSSVVRSDFTF